MIMNKETAIQAARFLLQIKAIKLNNENPFTWASGRKSPIYCDNRVTLSHPEIRTFIRQQFVAIVNELFADVDVKAGVATGGIPQGVLVAQDLGKPFVYVRPKAKDHGMGNQIEGTLPEGAKVVVVEDLISTGGSSLKAVDALRKAGFEIVGMVASYTYGFPVAEEAFKAANVRLITLSDYEHTTAIAAKTGYIQKEDLAVLAEWRKSPDTWKQ